MGPNFIRIDRVGLAILFYLHKFGFYEMIGIQLIIFGAEAK